MLSRMFNAALMCCGLSFAALAVGASSADASTIVNINASSGSGISLNFAAGTYAVTNVGIAGGGNYDGWDPWGLDGPPAPVSGCDSNGQNCLLGYIDQFAINFGGGVGTVYGYAGSPAGTPALAFALYQAGPLNTAPLDEALNDSDYTPFTGPITFTLAKAATVNFLVFDDPYYDNIGGMSLSVSAVPEPATWALMLFGVFGVGFMTRGSRRRHAVAAA